MGRDLGILFRLWKPVTLLCEPNIEGQQYKMLMNKSANKPPTMTIANGRCQKAGTIMAVRNSRDARGGAEAVDLQMFAT